MEPILGQIQLFGFNFAPRGWAHCDGTILPISQNQALFALFGNTYGGDGRSSFALPDLRGRIGVHIGTGPGLEPVELGERMGQNYIMLSEAHLPAHTHNITNTLSVKIRTSPPISEVNSSGDGIAALSSGGSTEMYTEDPNFTEYLPESSTQLGGDVVLNQAGQSQAINVMQPYLGVYHCIALTGTFPSRN